MADTTDMILHLSLAMNKMDIKIFELAEQVKKLENFSKLINTMTDDRLTKLEGGKKK